MVYSLYATRKTYLLTSAGSLAIALAAVGIFSILPGSGFLLAIPLILAALFGYFAWILFFAGLSSSPEKTIDGSLIWTLLDVIF